jgi:hypothetical protein
MMIPATNAARSRLLVEVKREERRRARQGERRRR